MGRIQRQKLNFICLKGPFMLLWAFESIRFESLFLQQIVCSGLDIFKKEYTYVIITVYFKQLDF